jgi:hypothetical protein
VRREVCSCYIIGAFTACITLTNHLLERYSKELLLQVEFGHSFLRFPNVNGDTPPPDLSKYLEKDLSAILAACKSKGLLSKEVWKTLDQYRDIFRNGFGHYDPAKILRDMSYTATTQLDADTSPVTKQIQFKDSSFAALAIDAFAEAMAWTYLAAVENFIRSTIKHFFNPEIDPNFPVIPLI